jgi:hypothetical protein
MKTREKIALGVSAILAMTVAIGATATFAWFRTTRNAVVNLTDAEVTGDGADLAISYYELSDTGALSETNLSNGFSISAAMNNVTDVSGTGAKFYKPSWSDTDNLIASSISQVTNNSADSYYIRFGIAFTNGGSGAFNVYFSDKTTVTPETATGSDAKAVATQQAKNDQAAKSVRMAFFNEGGTTALSMWQPDATDGSLYSNYQYLAPETGGTAYAASGKTTGYTLFTPNQNIFHIGSFPKIADKPAVAEPGQFLVTVPGNTTVKTEFGLWIEGTLRLAQKEEIGGRISATLGFIAL